METLAVGLTIGLAAGISPGPLLVLVITVALRSGWRAGALAACGPLLSDAVIGVVGAAFVVWMGVQTIRDARTASLVTDGGSRASRRSAPGVRVPPSTC